MDNEKLFSCGGLDWIVAPFNKLDPIEILGVNSTDNDGNGGDNDVYCKGKYECWGSFECSGNTCKAAGFNGFQCKATGYRIK